jgi:hypothetical protein
MSNLALVQEQSGLITMPAEEYHSLTDLSVSGLKHAAKSWAHFQEYKKNPPEPTKAMLFGTAFHTMMEYQMDWQKRVVRDIVADGRTKEGKAAKEAFKIENAGKLVVSPDDYDRLTAMFEKVINHPHAREFITGGTPELTARWTDEQTGVNCKARFDYLIKDVIVDFKTTSDASFDAVQRSVYNLKYHWQSAFYLDALKAVTGKESNKFVHIFVETEAPFEIQIFYLDDASLDFARQEYRQLIQQYACCLEENYWPGYKPGLQVMNLPAWVWNRG